MAEKKINTVLYDIDQSSDTTDEQKAIARANIGAQAELTAGDNIEIDPDTNTISSTSAPQVQADWTESDSTSASYIRNKPDLVNFIPGYAIDIDEVEQGFSISVDRNAIDKKLELVDHDQTLVGDGTSSEPLGVDEVEVGPQWNGTSWSSRYSMDDVELNSRDVQTGEILIPLDRIKWPFTKNDGNFSFVLVNVCGIRLEKMSGRTITPGETWKVEFSMANAEEENRIYYSQDLVTDFDLVWIDDSLTDYKGGWSTICLYDRSMVSPISLCLNFDFGDYKSSLDVGDLLRIHIEILPLSLRALNFG